MKHQAFISENLLNDGLGNVVIVRHKSNGRYEAGVFLLDTFCLGVKNAFYTDSRKMENSQELLDMVFTGGEFKEVAADYGRKIVESAVEYAKNLGFAPAKDYKMAARVFGGIPKDTCSEQFTFGYEGKPMYFQGPYDSAMKTQKILMMLERKVGKGNFNFTIRSDGQNDYADEQ